MRFRLNGRRACNCACHDSGLQGCHDCAETAHPHLLGEHEHADPRMAPRFHRMDFSHLLGLNIGK